MVGRRIVSGCINCPWPCSSYYASLCVWNDDYLNDLLLIQLPIGDYNKLDEISKGFWRNRIRPLDHCCGSLYGIAIRVKEPRESEVANALSITGRVSFLRNAKPSVTRRIDLCLYLAWQRAQPMILQIFLWPTLFMVLKGHRSAMLNVNWIACDDA